MGNVYDALINNKLTNVFGGLSANAVEPYHKGRTFVWFENIPKELVTFEGSLIKDLSIEDVQNILAALAEGVSGLPDVTLKEINHSGLSGLKFSAPDGIEYGDTFSVKFLEIQGGLIWKIFHSWVKLIVDYRTGMSNLKEFSASKYAATAYVWSTDPVGKIQYYTCFPAVWPNKEPTGYDGDKSEAGSKLDADITFKISGPPIKEEWVEQKCQSLFDAIFSQATSGPIMVQSDQDL